MTNAQDIAELLDNLNPQAKYAFITTHDKILPLEVIQEAIRYFCSFPAQSGEQRKAMDLALNRELLDEVVEMLVSNRQFAESAKYPDIVKSRTDKRAIFEELESRLNISKEFFIELGNTYNPDLRRRSDTSAEYALWLSEFGDQIGISQKKTKELVMKAVNFAYQASHVEPGYWGGEFPFSILPSLVQKLEEMGEKKEAWRLSQVALDQALIKPFKQGDHGITFLHHPDLYLQLAEKVYGTPEKAKEEFYLVLQKRFADLADIPDKDSQKDFSFYERKSIIDLMEKYGFSGINNYKLKEIEWRICDLRKRFAPFPYKEGQKCEEIKNLERTLTLAEQLGSDSLKKEIYGAAMEGLLCISQRGGGYVGACPNYNREAQRLIEGALTLRSVDVLNQMIKNAFEIRGVGDNPKKRYELVSLVEEAGLLEQLKPALGHNFPKMEGEWASYRCGTKGPLDHYRLILKVKGREYLSQIYEKEVSALESRGWIEGILPIARFVNDERRIAKYEPIIDWMNSQKEEKK